MIWRRFFARVIAVYKKTQVRKRVFDFCAAEKFKIFNDKMRNLFLLKHARYFRSFVIDSHEDGNVFVRYVLFFDKLVDTRGNPESFFQRALHTAYGDFLSGILCLTFKFFCGGVFVLPYEFVACRKNCFC